jgi:NitT/TauT family transport system substrate-binding protein
MKHKPIRIMMSRHSAFYSPLIATIAAGFLRNEGLEASYAVLPAGLRSYDLLRNGDVEIMQSAVSSNWGPMEKGERDLPVHFAQINIRDGFFLASRHPDASFDWKKLEGRSLLADHGHQPLIMLRHAVHSRGADWNRINVIDAGTPEAMEATFRKGRGDYVHLQGPAPQQLERDGGGYVVASIGKAMPPVAFSSLMATRGFVVTDEARAFTRAYRAARAWAREAPASDIARVEESYFPNIDRDALAKAIGLYQESGCWDGDIAIPSELYDQALDIFLHCRAITRRHPYAEVVVPPCVE